MAKRSPDRFAALAAASLLFCLIWVRPEPPTLYGIDAAFYALVAEQTASKPLQDWWVVTEGGQPFFEHPPGFLWLEAWAFRLGGVSSQTAVVLARAVATLNMLCAGFVAWAAGGAGACAWSLLGLCAASGFLHDAQNPMLEGCLGFGLLCCAVAANLLHRRPRFAGSLFCAGWLLALWTKGPPAAAALPCLAWAVFWRAVPVRRAVWVLTLSLSCAGLTLALYELWRLQVGAPAFVSQYFKAQLWPSLHVGRHHPVASPLYYLKTLWDWYPVPLAGALLAWPARRWQPALWSLGWLWASVVVVGFSLARQKYYWYTHPAVFGLVWAAVPGGVRLCQWWPRLWEILAAGSLLAMCLWCGCVLRWPQHLRYARPDVDHLYAQVPPTFERGEPRQIARCNVAQATWRETYLMRFLWHAQPVPCAAPAPYRYDGVTLCRQPCDDD